MNPKARTITLSDRAPIRIDEAEWPTIARAATIVDGVGCTIHVRQHADRRTIVYGVLGTESPRRAGYLLLGGYSPLDLAARIRDVAVTLGHRSLADQCIADLPAERI